jgi:hypothetical protein
MADWWNDTNRRQTGSGLDRDILTEACDGFTQFFLVNSGIGPKVRQEGFTANLSFEMSIHESPYDSTPQVLSY